MRFRKKKVVSGKTIEMYIQETVKSYLVEMDVISAYPKDKASPSVKEVVDGIDRLAKTIFGAITITHKHERLPKPTAGRVGIQMEDGRTYFGSRFMIDKYGGTNWAPLPFNVTVADGRIINNVSIEWEHE